MNTIEAFILGIIQGLTEYLPVSSSGHLAIGSALFGVNPEDNLTFDIVVHIATILSTIVILWKEVTWIFSGLFTGIKEQKMNDDVRYTINILISMIPIGIVGVFFKDYVEEIFGNGLAIVGTCLLVTAILLGFAHFYKPSKVGDVTPAKALIIGIAQAIAVLPGLSRSGSTIATGMLCGVDKSKLAQFSFLMVIPPILGEALLDGMKIMKHANSESASMDTTALIAGFIAAFAVGCLACKWMINLVKNGKMVYFAAYCGLVGIATLIYQFFIAA